MVKSPWPVDPVLGLPITQKRSTGNWTSSITNDIVVESLHDRAVFFEIESIELVFICGLIFRGDFFDDLNILIRVEGCEGFLSGLDIMELSEAIINLSEVII